MDLLLRMYLQYVFRLHTIQLKTLLLTIFVIFHEMFPSMYLIKIWFWGNNHFILMNDNYITLIP